MTAGEPVLKVVTLIAWHVFDGRLVERAGCSWGIAGPHFALVVRFDLNQSVLVAVKAPAHDFVVGAFDFQKVERDWQKVCSQKPLQVKHVPAAVKLPVHQAATAAGLQKCCEPSGVMQGVASGCC